MRELGFEPSQVHGHGHRLVVCCLTHPLQLSESQPLHLRSMFSKSMRCTQNCNTCIWHWSTERAQFFSTTMPDHMSHVLQKLNKLGYKVLPHPPYSTDLLPTNYHNLWQRKCFHNQQGGRKCFPKVPEILKHIFLCHRNKSTYFLLAKIC